MRLTVILMLILFPLKVLAQTLSGTVIDKITGRPVANATVSSSRNIASTYADGVFKLTGVYPGDSLTVSSIGYKTYKIGIDLSTPKIVTVYLQQANILLQSVVVKAKYDPKIDSIRTRKQFQTIFGYQKPTFMDMFVTVNPYKYVPFNYIDAPNSTAQIVNVNLLSVFALLEKNKTQTSALQKTLLKDEESNYVDRVFSKQKVTGLTNLKGDSLTDFMAVYRPDVKQARKMTDYEMIIYIRDSYNDFVKTYNVNERSPFNK